LDALARPLTARFIIVPRHLESQLQQQLLHRFQDAPDDVALGGEVGQVNSAGNRQFHPLSPD
jgi:hypothetical protein